MPQISVIVPVYNAEKKLTRCINSILNQTFDNFELILIDDGSTDNSGKICDEFAVKDSRIQVFHSQNQGVSSARNSGIKRAKGEYIAFVDSDDYVYPSFLKIMLEKALSLNADFVMSSYVLCSNDKTEPQYHHFKNDVLTGEKQITEKIIKRVIYVKDTTGLFSPWGKFFKRSIINEYYLCMDKDMSFGEDMLFVLSYIDKCKKIAFVNDPLYYYEQDKNGLFNRYRSSFLYDIMKCYKNLKFRADNLSETDAYLPISVKYRYYIERHIKAGIKLEKHKFKFIYDVYKNGDVRDVFKNINKNRKTLLKNQSWVAYELRLPKLIANNFLFLATLYSLYQYDENNFLRKLKNLIC